MAWDFKKDWESFEKQFDKITSDMVMNRAAQTDNSDMAEIVNRYRYEAADFYKGISEENAFTTVSQEFWYMHHLNRNRLRRLGVEVCYDQIRETPGYYDRDKRYPFWYYSKEGKNRVCCLKDFERATKVYLQNGQTIYVDEQNKELETYYLITSKTENGRYFCPGCGKDATLDELLDGCDSCNMKFQLSDFATKIISMHRPNGFLQERDGSVFAKISFGVGLSGKKESSGMERAPLLLLREDDPFFSEEHFYAGLVNKVLSIHYAESMEELRPFVEQDLTGLIKQCHSVVEVRLNEYMAIDYRKDEENQYLVVYVKLNLMICKEGRMCLAKPELKLHMIRSLQAIKAPRHEAVVYRCRNCGASLSLLNGLQCEYCGTCLDLKKYDWVIRRVEVVPKR